VIIAVAYAVLARHAGIPDLGGARSENFSFLVSCRTLIGGTGLIGSKSVAILRQGGNEAIPQMA
jgi:hypothetical protein